MLHKMPQLLYVFCWKLQIRRVSVLPHFPSESMILIIMINDMQCSPRSEGPSGVHRQGLILSAINGVFNCITIILDFTETVY